MTDKANERDGMSGSGGRPLKLRVHDAEDLEALAACLQDALVSLADMAYLEGERRFVMVASRFCWECARADGLEDDPPREAAGDARFEDVEETPPPFARVNCGICFDRVRAVRSRGLDRRDRGQILNLLTMRAEAGAIDLMFSGGAEVRLEITQIRCHMEDLGEPWPTRWRPAHADGEAGS
ncbi:MAG: DUF2948 family protein [Kiloniellaceae bacterium]